MMPRHVTDTGVGIAREDQGAVFEEFRQVGTADKKVDGTGLGLALSRRFTELQGGRILVTVRLSGERAHEPLLLGSSRAIWHKHSAPQYAATKYGRQTRVRAMLYFSGDRMHEHRCPISRARKWHAGQAAREESGHENEQRQEDGHGLINVLLRLGDRVRRTTVHDDSCAFARQPGGDGQSNAFGGALDEGCLVSQF
jgi:hypothetical protein